MLLPLTTVYFKDIYEFLKLLLVFSLLFMNKALGLAIVVNADICNSKLANNSYNKYFEGNKHPVQVSLTGVTKSKPVQFTGIQGRAC